MNSDTAPHPTKTANRSMAAAPLILVAEDDRDSREALAAFLESLGYRVVIFANTLLRIAAKSIQDALLELRRSGEERRTAILASQRRPALP